MSKAVTMKISPRCNEFSKLSIKTFTHWHTETISNDNRHFAGSPNFVKFYTFNDHTFFYHRHKCNFIRAAPAIFPI